MKIKTKLILWYTLLVAVLMAMVLTFFLTAGGKILFTSAEKILRSQTQEMTEEIEYENDKLLLDDDFRLSSKGVQMMIYRGKQLEIGQILDDDLADEPIEVGKLRRIGNYACSADCFSNFTIDCGDWRLVDYCLRL